MKPNYHEVLDQLAESAKNLLQDGAGVLFVTNVRSKLNAAYIRAVRNAGISNGLDPEAVKELVKYYSCSTCAKFMARVGHLVVEDQGEIRSVYWDPSAITDPIFKEVVHDLKQYVEGARIINIYNPNGPYLHYTEHTDLGGKPFRHFHIDQKLLTHRHSKLGLTIDLPDLSKQFDQFAAVIRFTKEVTLKSAMVAESMFEEKRIYHVGSSKKTLKDFIHLQTSLAAIRAGEKYQLSIGDYNKDTLLINEIWIALSKNLNMLSIRGSILGKLLQMIETCKETGSKRLEEIQEFWKTQTDGLHYMRTSREASAIELSQTAKFLEENNWNDSLKQVEAAEEEIPVHWVAAKRWTFNTLVKEVQQDFSNFAVRKNLPSDHPTSTAVEIDGGYFFNKVLPFVESLGLVLTGSTFSPVLINRMASMDAKPIFRWDTEEKRSPFIPWRYNSPFYVGDLIVDKSVMKDGKVVVPVVSVTSDSAIGYKGREEGNPIIFFQMAGLQVANNPHPALFAEALKSELYNHRRGLEDYARATEIPRCEGQQSLSLLLGPKNPHNHNRHFVLFEVSYNAEGKARFGELNGLYKIDLGGYSVTPDVEQYPIIDRRESVVETISGEDTEYQETTLV